MLTQVVVTPDELGQRLADPAGINPAAQFCSITTATPAPLYKRAQGTKALNPWFGRVLHVVKRRGQIAVRYSRCVQAQRRREAENARPGSFSPGAVFRAKPLWNGHGERFGPFLSRHQAGELYITFRPQTDARGRLVFLQEEWRLDTPDGALLTLDVLRPFLRPKIEGSKRQGVRLRIPWRTVSLDHVLELRMCGVRYIVTPAPPNNPTAT